MPNHLHRTNLRYAESGMCDNQKLIGISAVGTGGATSGWVRFYAFTALASGKANSIFLYSLASGNVKVAIYDGNENLLASGTKACTLNQWNIVQLDSVATLVKNNTYYLGFIGDVANVYSTSATATNHTQYFVSSTYEAWSWASTYDIDSKNVYTGLYSVSAFVSGLTTDGSKCAFGCAYDAIEGTACIVNPNISSVSSVARKYWKISGDTVSEMDAGEKSTKDAALTAELAADRNPLPNKAATTLGMGLGGSGVAVAASGTLYVDLDPATTRMLITSFTCNKVGGVKMLFGVCSKSSDSITIKHVMSRNSSSVGDVTFTGFTPFTILPGEYFWVYCGDESTYGRVNRVTTPESGFTRGYYYIAVADGTTIAVDNVYNSISQSATSRLRIQAIGD